MTGPALFQNHTLDPTPEALRLTLHEPGTSTGQVDGAWWPRSDVLGDELPGLLTVLTDRLGPIERLSYDLADWAPADRRLRAGGRRVRLDGFRRRTPAGLVHATGTRGGVVSLLVVPPTTAEERATAVLRRAADPTVTLAALRSVGDGPDRPPSTTPPAQDPAEPPVSR